MLNNIVEYAKNNPYVVAPLAIIAMAAATTAFLYHPVLKEKLTQTEYTIKLANENVELTKKAGEELSKQVQLYKAYQSASGSYFQSIAKVSELDKKIAENREKIYSTITTE